MAPDAHAKLPRLPPEWYRGRAAVFWTHTVDHRCTGWLTAEFHHQFREILLHACARYALACPAYVVMPDHWHLVGLGMEANSDQLRANKFLREHLGRVLKPWELQPQAHDHVLREEERKRGGFQSACHYIFNNPTRAGLVDAGKNWPYLGAMISGYPKLEPQADDYWERFWAIYMRNPPAP